MRCEGSLSQSNSPQHYHPNINCSRGTNVSFISGSIYHLAEHLAHAHVHISITPSHISIFVELISDNPRKHIRKLGWNRSIRVPSQASFAFDPLWKTVQMMVYAIAERLTQMTILSMELSTLLSLEYQKTMSHTTASSLAMSTLLGIER